jgi:hypothetical protein
MKRLALCLAILGASCAQIGDPQTFDPDDPNNPDGPGEPIDPALCEADGDSGSTCEVTGDCQQPFVCLNGACVGPQNPDVTCDVVDNVACPNADEVCVGGVCVINPGACVDNDACPLGYVCESGQCAPEREGQACSDVGPGPDLSGTWELDSTLHLRDGLPDVVDGILDVAEDARDLINGDVDFGLPGLVEDVIGGVIASIIDNYVPQYAQNLVVALGDMSDILDDMRVESTVTLRGEPCEGRYRGTEVWNRIRFTFRGQELVLAPDQLPGVDEIIPDDFAAWYSCGELFIDRHRIDQKLGGLVRFLVDNITNAITGAPNVETALQYLVDCPSFAFAVDNYVGQVCSFCPGVQSAVNFACNTAVNAGIAKISEEIDNAAVKLSLIKKKGIATVASGSQLSSGQWYGTLVGGDFPGEFTAQKR